MENFYNLIRRKRSAQDSTFNYGHFLLPFFCFPSIRKGVMIMKFKKTPISKRTQYIYTYNGINGEERQLHIISGENGVTDEHIARLHAFDDSEVYNNLKNFRSPLSDDEKANIKKWSVNRPDLDIPLSLSNSNNISLDYCMDHQNEKEAKEVIEQTCTYFDNIPQDVERLREIVELLPAFDRKIYELVVINEMSNVEAAARLSVSEGTVRYHMKNIIEFIRKKF